MTGILVIGGGKKGSSLTSDSKGELVILERRQIFLIW